MTVIQTPRDGQARRVGPLASVLAQARRAELTPYRLRCVTCGKIIGELGEGGSATINCPPCRRMTLGLVENGRLLLVDMGSSFSPDSEARKADGGK